MLVDKPKDFAQELDNLTNSYVSLYKFDAVADREWEALAELLVPRIKELILLIAAATED